MSKPEQKIQTQVANYLRLRYPRMLWTISPAGLVRGASMAVLMKRMGYRNGTADLLILEPKSIWHGLFIELKAPGGTVADDQTEFLADAAERKYATAVCWSYQEAIQTVDKYMDPFTYEKLAKIKKNFEDNEKGGNSNVEDQTQGQDVFGTGPGNPF